MQRMGFVLAAGAALFAGVVSADVSLPNIFNHNMVLQRGQPVPVWGWAAPGEQVTVSFAGQTQKTEAGKDGAWRVTLRALQASSIRDLHRFRCKHGHLQQRGRGRSLVLFRQSNMEWRMANVDNAEQERCREFR